LLQHFVFAQESCPATFLKSTIEEEGFIRLRTEKLYLSAGEKIEATAQILVSKIVVKARNDTTADTLVIEQTVNLSTEDCFVLIFNRKNGKSRYVNVFAVDMCKKYYDRSGIKKELLTWEDLKNFASKAKWSIKKLK
jgi:hypothetical protein